MRLELHEGGRKWEVRASPLGSLCGKEGSWGNTLPGPPGGERGLRVERAGPPSAGFPGRQLCGQLPRAAGLLPPPPGLGRD